MQQKSVSGVREFLGAGLIEGFQHLRYVPTARQFSKEAQDLAERAAERELISVYKLIDLSRLQVLLEAASR